MIPENDELIEYLSFNEILDYDPINPNDGFYYLWNEATKRIHTHFNGKQHFSTYDFCRFVRSCSTSWPFLKIYRHWTRRKEDIIKRAHEKSSIRRILLGE